MTEEKWRFLVDPGKVRRAAHEALKQIGSPASIHSTRIGLRVHAGAIPASCDELWCVKLSGSAQEIRECMGVDDGHPEMVEKLVTRFSE